MKSLNAIKFLSYCPEEDIQGKFIPSPPEITSFPLPQLPVAVYGPPIVKQELLPYPAAPEIPQPIHAEYGIPLVKQEIPPPVIHAEYGVPHQEVLIVKEAAYPAKQEVLDEEIIVPHEEYGVPHAEYGVPETSSTTTTTTVKPHKEKIVTYIQPKLVILKKKFEFPILKKLLEKKFKKFL